VVTVDDDDDDDDNNDVARGWSTETAYDRHYCWRACMYWARKKNLGNPARRCNRERARARAPSENVCMHPPLYPTQHGTITPPSRDHHHHPHIKLPTKPTLKHAIQQLASGWKVRGADSGAVGPGVSWAPCNAKYSDLSCAVLSPVRLCDGAWDVGVVSCGERVVRHRVGWRFTGRVRVRGAYSLSAATMIENAEVKDHAGSENVKTKKRRVNRVLFSNYDRSDRTIAGCWVGRNCGEAFITV